MTPRKKATRKLGGNRDAKVLDEQNVTKSGTFGNSDLSRQLIRCQDGRLLYQLAQGKAYEVVGPNGEECWNFSLRYQAESKFERLAGKETR
jgi:hypothetical protein